MRRLSIRCSSLPTIAKCPQSAYPAELYTRSDSNAANIGTAAHACIQSWVQYGEPSQADVTYNAKRYDVDEEELSPLCWAGWRCWLKIRQHFPDPFVELWLHSRLETQAGVLEIDGHPDLISMHGETVCVLDWKTGREDTDYRRQLMGYAWLGMQELPTATKAYGCVVNVRSQTIEGWEWTREEVQEWIAGLAATLLGDDAPYNPGRHCGYCKRAPECKAHHRELQYAAFQLQNAQPIPADAPPLVRGTQLAKSLDAARQMENLIERLREVARAEVIQAGGKLPTSDGRELVIATTEKRTVNYGDVAHGIISDYITPVAITPLLTIGKTRLEGAIGAASPRGQKGAKIKECFERLEEAGCLTVLPTDRLECRRVAQEIEVDE